LEKVVPNPKKACHDWNPWVPVVAGAKTEAARWALAPGTGLGGPLGENDPWAKR